MKCTVYNGASHECKRVIIFNLLPVYRCFYTGASHKCTSLATVPDMNLISSLVLTTFQHTDAIYTGVSHECEAFTTVPDMNLSALLVLTTFQHTVAIYIGARHNFASCNI